MKVSFITTVLNEADSIEEFLRSVVSQTRKPDEIVIVDGGSTDTTVARIKKYELRIKNIRILQKKGNRSIGRNEAIRHTSGDIIAIADAGCILEKDWLQNIIEPFTDPKTDVVAGFYKGKSDSVLQKCVIPYVLVMPDKVNPESFLPATRSMAIRKRVWEDLGGFPERFSHNEDYVFANRLQKAGKKIIFTKNAVVDWIPPHSLHQIYRMFYRFALGDAEAGILRPKVALLLARYILGIILVSAAVLFKLIWLWWLVVLGLILYLLWAAWKNYHYVRDVRAVFLLPFLQLLSDMAVISGSLKGFLKTTK